MSQNYRHICLLSVALINPRAKKQHREERVYFIYSPSSRETKEGTEDKDLERTEAETWRNTAY